MISLEEAQKQVWSSVAPLGVEQVDLMESVGRVLAQTLMAPHDLPPFDNAAMDGYALRAEDICLCAPTSPRGKVKRVLNPAT